MRDAEDAYRQVRRRLDLSVIDLGPTQLKNIAEPIRVYSLAIPAKSAPASASEKSTRRPSRLSSCRSPISAATWSSFPRGP
jgi:adenylate cyclase